MPAPRSDVDEMARPDVLAVFDELTVRFGPGCSNGVMGILLHDGLPDHFGRECWKDWTFRPAEAAFVWAHNRGLITPWKCSAKWQFTELGRAAHLHATTLYASARDQHHV